MHNRIRNSRIPVFFVVLSVLFLVSGAYRDRVILPGPEENHFP